MSSDAATLVTPSDSVRPSRRSFRARRAKPGSPFTPHGEPLLWLTGGALVVALVMIVCLLSLIMYQGFATFWPQPLFEITSTDGTVYLGELSREEKFTPGEASLKRSFLKTSPRKLTQKWRPTTANYSAAFCEPGTSMSRAHIFNGLMIAK